MANLWDGLITSIKSSSMTPAMKVACLAQAILESGRGSSRVCHECQNFWGMKMRPELAAIAVGQEVPVTSETEGRATFAKFANTDIAVTGWLVFLSRPYYKGWQAYQDDATGFIRHIGKSWCPRADYADAVIQLLPEALKLLQMEMPQPPRPDVKPLQRGAKGDEVELLQQELNDHFDAGLEVDGDFGSNTEAAVKQVEEILGTAADGIVDSDLWGALLTLEGIKQDLTPDAPAKNTDIPFAVRMRDIPTRWTYEGGWPTGAILHFTAGRDDPRGTVEYLAKCGYPCLVMGRDGTVYQPFPASCGGSHCGTHHHETSVGLEVISAGRCTPVVLDGVTKYAPWFAYQNGDPRTGVISKPDDCFTAAEMRHVDRLGSCREGWYQVFTPAQEAAIIKVFLWYKWADPTKRFDFAKVLGHDEACDQGGRPGAKNDPGGALSMPMADLRSLLNQKWTELLAKTPAEQQAMFARS
jgi:hypothetical protein